MKFLKFTSESEAIAAFAQWATEDAAFPFYIGTVVVDPVGVIHKPTGVMLTDAEGNEHPEMAPIPGWHVNLSCLPEDCPSDLRQYIIDAPTTPSRVFGGS